MIWLWLLLYSPLPIGSEYRGVVPLPKSHGSGELFCALPHLRFQILGFLPRSDRSTSKSRDSLDNR